MPIVTTGVRRVGFASRSGITARRPYGFLVGFGVGLGLVEAFGLADGEADGLADGLAASSGAASSDAWWSPSAEIHSTVPGTPSAPGVTTMPRRSSQPGAWPASRYCALYAPLELLLAFSMATIRAFGPS